MAHIKVPLPNSNIQIYTLRNIQKTSDGRYFCSVKNNLGNPEAYSDITSLWVSVGSGSDRCVREG